MHTACGTRFEIPRMCRLKAEEKVEFDRAPWTQWTQILHHSHPRPWNSQRQIGSEHRAMATTEFPTRSLQNRT